MPDKVGTDEEVTDYEAQSLPIEAAASKLHEVIDGFAEGDTRPLVIGDADRPVLVVLAIADLADFRAKITHMLADPVDAGWFRYYLSTTYASMSPERLSELLGVDTDHGLTSLCSQVSVEQAAVLLPDQLRRAEDGANPLMLIGDGRLANAALISFEAFAVLLDLEGDNQDDTHSESERLPAALETLAAQLGPVSTQIVAQINATRSDSTVVYDLHFEDDLIDHLRDLESRAQSAPGGGAYEELRGMLRSLDEMRSGNVDPEAEEVDTPYVEAADLPGLLGELRDNFRSGENDDPYLIGINGEELAGLVTYELYELIQEVSVQLDGTDEVPVLPLPTWDGGPPVEPFPMACEIAPAVVQDIANGEGSILFVADEDGDPELVLAPLAWLWAYVDHLDTTQV